LKKWLITGILLALTGLCLHESSRAQLLLFDNKVEVSGSLTAQASVYSSSAEIKRLEPFSWRIYGSPRIRMKDWYIPMNLVLGSYQDQARQAFNKFGLSPEYKDWLILHFGHRNLNFSPLLLGGKTILGVGFEVNPKKFRAGFIWGRFDRAVAPDSASAYQPTYKRNGFAAKIGYGTRSNYVDLVFLHAKDDEGSLDTLPANKMASPQENSVLGLTIRQRIVKNLHFKFDAALSAYSLDTRVGAPEVEESGFAKAMSLFLPIRKSNQYLTAIRTSLEYRVMKYNAGIEYERIEPDFKSMGAWFIRNDIERVTLSGGFSALKQKLNGTARIGLQRNNILKDRSTKSFQNVNSINLNYRPDQQWLVTLGYTNYMTRQTLSLLGFEDSTLLNRRMNNVTLATIYRWGGNDFGHTARILVSYQGNRDKAKSSPLVFSSFNVQLGYRIDIPEYGLYVAPSFTINSYKFTTATTMRYNPAVTVGKAFLEKKLNAYLNSGFSFSRSGGAAQKSVYRNILNVSYKILKKQTLTLRLTHTSNQGKATGLPSYTEFMGDVVYAVSF